MYVRIAVGECEMIKSEGKNERIELELCVVIEHLEHHDALSMADGEKMNRDASRFVLSASGHRGRKVKIKIRMFLDMPF
jgi:hypothetical protein